MKCMSERKGSYMLLFKRILPTLLLITVCGGLGYLFGRGCSGLKTTAVKQTEAVEKLQKGVIAYHDEDKQESIECPPIPACPVSKAKTCPPPVVQQVPVDRVVERVVYVERKVGYGCHVNWSNGEVIARSKPGQSIECHVNRATRKVDTYMYDKSMLRRGPLPGGVLDDALKSYEKWKEGRL